MLEHGHNTTLAMGACTVHSSSLSSQHIPTYVVVALTVSRQSGSFQEICEKIACLDSVSTNAAIHFDLDTAHTLMGLHNLLLLSLSY
jgi:hypothetical protein